MDAFKASIKEYKPERAIVSKIEFEDYSCRVTKLSNFAQALTAGQLLKAIPILQNIQDQVKVLPDIQEKVGVLPEIRDSTAETAESLREDKMTRMERDIQTLKAKLGMA